MSWIERADGTDDDLDLAPEAPDNSGPEYLPPWTYMLGGPSPLDQDDPEPRTRPLLDPEEHAGRPLDREQRERRCALLAATRDANRAARRLSW